MLSKVDYKSNKYPDVYKAKKVTEREVQITLGNNNEKLSKSFKHKWRQAKEYSIAEIRSRIQNA